MADEYVPDAGMLRAHERYVHQLGDPEEILDLTNDQLIVELGELADYLEPVDDKRTRRDRIYRELLVRRIQRRYVAAAARVTSSAVGQSVKALNQREAST